MFVYFYFLLVYTFTPHNMVLLLNCIHLTLVTSYFADSDYSVVGLLIVTLNQSMLWAVHVWGRREVTTDDEMRGGCIKAEAAHFFFKIHFVVNWTKTAKNGYSATATAWSAVRPPLLYLCPLTHSLTVRIGLPKVGPAGSICPVRCLFVL